MQSTWEPKWKERREVAELHVLGAYDGARAQECRHGSANGCAVHLFGAFAGCPGCRLSVRSLRVLWRLSMLRDQSVHLR